MLDLANRGWLDIEEHSLPLVGSALRVALHDPNSWISTIDGEHRMVMLITTDAWADIFRPLPTPLTKIGASREWPT